MKPWIKILFTGIVILALIFSVIYIFLVFQGKALITKQLEDLTKKKVSIGYFGINPPFNIKIKNLNIEGLAKVDSVSISPSILGFLMGGIALNDVSIVSPEVTYQKFSSEAIIESPQETVPSPSSSLAVKKKQPLRLIFKNINIKNGKINFIDHTAGESGIKLVVKDIKFNLTNLYVFPRSVITNFQLKAKIPWQEDSREGKIEAEGWLNLLKKDMQATLKIEGIDGIYLYPYYSNWVDLEKTRIQSAKLNFSSNIHGLNNNVTAECHLELTDIVRKPLQEGEAEEKAAKITDAVLEIFRALNQGKIVLDFTIRTKMDRPEFGFGNIKMAFEDKLAQGKKTNGFNPQDILSLPAKFVQGTFKGLTDITTAVVSGTISAGKEIVKTVEDTFKKEKEE